MQEPASLHCWRESGPTVAVRDDKTEIEAVDPRGSTRERIELIEKHISCPI